MIVTIKTISGPSFEVEVEESDTVNIFVVLSESIPSVCF